MPGKRRTAEDARQAIRDAAVELFVAGGYGATSLQDIAGQVGLTRQAALYHFRSKEELLRSVVDPYLDDLAAVLDGLAANDAPDVADQEATLTALVEVVAAHRGVVSLLSRFTTATTTAGLGTRLAELGARMRTLLAGSRLESDPALRLRTQAAVSAIIGVVSARDLPLDDPADRRVLVEAALAVLADRP